MKPSELKTYCYYCQKEIAEHTRLIPIRRSNGFKLMDFKAELCQGCNNLNDKLLSDYFSV